ncbi:MAG: ATP-binding protein [Oscillospiraceae bacterium]|nr:ATP-binding protein [Oscillospiraceae bacterium]
MNTIKKIINEYFRSEDLPIEARKINTIYLSGMASALYGFITRLLMGAGARLLLVIIGIMLLITLFHFMYHRFQIYYAGAVLCVVTVCYILLPLVFFFLGGVFGSNASYFLIGIVIIFLLMRGRFLVLFASIHVAIIGACYYVNAQFPNFIVHIGGSQEYLESFKYLDAVQTITVAAIFICPIILFQSRLYDSELKKTIAANTAKSDALAKISHEIRTPLNAILGMAELVLHEDIPLTSKNYVFIVKQAGQNLLSIINDILDFSKIEAGVIEVISEKYSLSSVINDVINIIKVKVYDSRLRFIVNIDDRLPSTLYGDAAKIRQIMLNLLSNSVKYTEEGYVSLSISGKREADDIENLIIKVADSGKGIKQDDIGRLFEAFTQFDREHNVNIEGTGLGLAITQSFVSALNGEITVSSVYGEGSVFSVVIPQKIREYDALATVTDPKNKSVLIFERRQICIDSIVRIMEGFGVKYEIVSSTEVFYEKISYGNITHVFLASILYEKLKKEFPVIKSDAKVILIAEFGEIIRYQDVSILSTPIYCIPVAQYLNGVFGGFVGDINMRTDLKFIAPEAKVLVVDDIKTNLTVSEGLLLPYEVQVDLFMSGAEAIAACKVKHYDLVLMDHMMPVMDGIETTKRIRALAENGDKYYLTLPIVVLTANAISGMKEMAMQNGFNDFIPKPIDTSKLSSVLERWLPKEKQKKPVKADRRLAREIEDVRQSVRIEGLDVAKGVVLTGGTVENFLKVLGTFYQDGIKKIEEIKSSLEEGDVLLLTTHIHALKNACAIIGADKLSEAAEALELAGRRRDIEYLNDNVYIFLLHLESTLSSLNTVLSLKREEKQKAPIDVESLRNNLEGLREAFQDFDSEAMRDRTNALRSVESDAEISDAIKDILKSKLVGEYDEAVTLIDSLLAELSIRNNTPPGQVK